jgi:hypothetical protein
MSTLIINNYLHDVATAVLLSSAVILYVLGRQARAGGDGERRAFARAPDSHPIRTGRARVDHHRRDPADALLSRRTSSSRPPRRGSSQT